MIEPGVALSTLAYSGMGGAGLGFSFLVVRWMASFIAGRSDAQAAHIDAATARLIEGLERRLDQEIETRRQLEAATQEELRELRLELAECNRRHADAEEEVSRLKGLILGVGDARNHAQLIIAADKQAAKKDDEQ